MSKKQVSRRLISTVAFPYRLEMNGVTQSWIIPSYPRAPEDLAVVYLETRPGDKSEHECRVKVSSDSYDLQQGWPCASCRILFSSAPTSIQATTAEEVFKKGSTSTADIV